MAFLKHTKNTSLSHDTKVVLQVISIFLPKVDAILKSIDGIHTPSQTQDLPLGWRQFLASLWSSLVEGKGLNLLCFSFLKSHVEIISILTQGLPKYLNKFI